MVSNRGQGSRRSQLLISSSWTTTFASTSACPALQSSHSRKDGAQEEPEQLEQGKGRCSPRRSSNRRDGHAQETVLPPTSARQPSQHSPPRVVRSTLPFPLPSFPRKQDELILGFSFALLHSPPSPAQMDWSTHFPTFFDPPTERGAGSGPGKGKKVEFADVGCGFGGLSISLAPLFPETPMLGTLSSLLTSRSDAHPTAVQVSKSASRSPSTFPTRSAPSA